MKLKEIRKKHGMTAEDVAKEIGVTQAAVANWENNKRTMNIDVLVKLTQIFGCSADELLGIDRKSRTESEA